VVTHKPDSNNAFRNLACERSPRLRRFGGFATFFLMAQPPLLRKEGNGNDTHRHLFTPKNIPGIN